MPSYDLPADVKAHYQAGREESRLTAGKGLLEFSRTQDILLRYLPAPPGTVLDVGGGSGIYACWLAQLGYTVHLLDAIPLHIEQARQASARQLEALLASASLGDARSLPHGDSSIDALLLLGPLYHLTSRKDRLQSLAEARRVLRPGGILFAAGISRFASALDGLLRRFLDDPEFAAIVRQDLKDGQHRNPHNTPGYFTTAFFHHPDELRAETQEAGFPSPQILAIEGPAWLLPDTSAYLHNLQPQSPLMETLRLLETEPSLLGQSAHLMCIGYKPLE